MFVNRIKELKRLQTALNRAESQVIVVWGRRRCGKTALLREALTDKAIFFTADLRESRLQMNALASEVARLYEGFDKVIYPDWETLLIQLNQRIRNKAVLCLDEFPYLVKNSPELPSVLQKLIDQSRLDHLDLIICGSSQQMMQGIALSADSPLYGRSHEILKVTPMDLVHLSSYLQTNAEDTIREYGVWGGVPRYWRIRESAASLEDAIKYHVLDRQGILYEEPERLFADEMRTSVQTWSVLSVIASGSHRLSEIAARLEKPATQLSRLLSFLVDLGYLRRDIPFGESPKSSKRSLYKINDSFLNFYFRFVLPNKSRLESDQVDQVWEQIKSQYDLYLSDIWENLCRNAVLSSFEGLPDLMPASRWWGTGLLGQPVEADLVAESTDRKTIVIGEVKWSKVKNLTEVENQLDRIISYLPIIQNRSVIKLAFVRNKPLDYQGQMLIFTPDDLITKV